MKLIVTVEVETTEGFDLFDNAKEFGVFLKRMGYTTYSYSNTNVSVTSKVVEE